MTWKILKYLLYTGKKERKLSLRIANWRVFSPENKSLLNISPSNLSFICIYTQDVLRIFYGNYTSFTKPLPLHLLPHAFLDYSRFWWFVQSNYLDCNNAMTILYFNLTIYYGSSRNRGEDLIMSGVNIKSIIY